MSEWAAVLISGVSAFGGALIVLLRMTSRWTRLEDQMGRITDDMRDLVSDKDRTHAEMLAQMREDRSVTDRRLRWLEENLWKARNRGGAQ